MLDLRQPFLWEGVEGGIRVILGLFYVGGRAWPGAPPPLDPHLMRRTRAHTNFLYLLNGWADFVQIFHAKSNTSNNNISPVQTRMPLHVRVTCDF